MLFGHLKMSFGQQSTYPFGRFSLFRTCFLQQSLVFALKTVFSALHWIKNGKLDDQLQKFFELWFYFRAYLPLTIIFFKKYNGLLWRVLGLSLIGKCPEGHVCACSFCSATTRPWSLNSWREFYFWQSNWAADWTQYWFFFSAPCVIIIACSFSLSCFGMFDIFACNSRQPFCAVGSTQNKTCSHSDRLNTFQTSVQGFDFNPYAAQNSKH